MNYQLAFVVVLILLVIFVVYYVYKIKSYDKLLYDYKPLKQKYDKLAEDHERLKLKTESENGVKTPPKKEKNPEKSKSKDSKSKDSKSQSTQESPVVADLQEKVKTLEEENAKLKEKNYNLSKDNKALRKDARTSNESNEQDQHELIELREAKKDLTASLESAKSKIAVLEKLISEASDNVSKPASDEAKEPTDENKKTEKLERENAALKVELKDVRGELDAFKRDFKTQVDEAKKAVADSNRALKNDVAKAERIMQQSKKRADNNHKIYLIARAQMMLAEKRLMSFDASYKSPIALPTSNEAIDEVIKKLNTVNARQSKISEKEANLSKASGNAPVNSPLKQSTKEDTSVLGLGLSLDGLGASKEESESLSDLVSKLSNVADHLGDGKTSSGTKDFSNLDLSNLDDWDVL